MYLPISVPTIRHILQRNTKRGLVIAALEKLAALGGDSLDVGGVDWGAWGVEEVRRELGVGIEGVDVDETVIGCYGRVRHFWGFAVEDGCVLISDEV